MESVGFKLGYEMISGEPADARKAEEEYFHMGSYLRGAALEAFEAAVKRGKEEALRELAYER
jgi:hypothetical protein